MPTLSNNKKTSSEKTTSADDFLVFPRTYFEPKTGAGPKNVTDALRWWEWRESRRNGLDNEDPCGKKMMKEVASLRASLRSFIGNQYLIVLKERCSTFGLMNETTGNHAVLQKDINAALSTLENTPENNELVFNIFFKFHKDRKWMARTIDKWMLSRKMVLQPQVKKQGVKLFRLNRGGFMDVARHAKSNKIARFKNHLFKTKRWTIALSTPSTQPNVNKKNYVPKHYRKVFLDAPTDAAPTDAEDDDKEKIKFYYVVTALDNSIDDTIIDHSIDNRANLDELVDVDYAAIARCLKTTTNAVMNAISSNVFYKLDAESKNNNEDIVDITGADDIIMDEGDGNEAAVEDVSKNMIEPDNVPNLDVQVKNNAISIILNAMTEVESDLSDSTAPPPTNTEKHNAPPLTNDAEQHNAPPQTDAEQRATPTPPPTNAEEPPPPTTNAAEHNAPPPTNDAEQHIAPPPSFDAEQQIVPPPANAEQHNAGATTLSATKNTKERNTPPPINTKENNAPPPPPTNAEEHNAPQPTNDAEQHNAPPPSFDAEQHILPPPANAEEHNAGATNTEEHNTPPPINTEENNAPPPPPTNVEELNAEATTKSVEAASKSPPPAAPIPLTSQKQSSTSESTITSTTTPPLTSETDLPSTPVKTSPSLASENTPMDGKTTPVKIPGCTYMSQRIRTPTPPRFGTHNFDSIVPNKLYSKKNAVSSLKRKTPSPSKKKSKVRH